MYKVSHHILSFLAICTFFGLALMLVPPLTTFAQSGTPSVNQLSATLFREKDWLVLYLGEANSTTPQNVTLRNLQFAFANQPTVRFDKFEAAFGIKFDQVRTPACLRLQRENTGAAFPTECKNARQYSTEVAPSDVFWFDAANNRRFSMDIIGVGNDVDCPLSAVSCPFNVPVVQNSGPVPTVPGVATALPVGNTILFTRNGEIFRMDRLGKNVVQLSDDRNMKRGYPALSHSGNYIVFEASTTKVPSAKIFRMNVDGSGLIQLTNGSPVDRDATYSPDDTKILFTSRSNNIDHIKVMNADGSNVIDLTPTSGINSQNANWSPDGKQIVFSSNRTGKWEIWTMNADGSNPTQITFNNAGSYAPVWSPDGNYIAFQSDASGNNGYDIYVLKLNSGDRFGHRITNDGNSRVPRWSPDGQFILMQKKATSTIYDLYVVNRDGNGDPNPIMKDAQQAYWGE